MTKKPDAFSASLQSTLQTLIEGEVNKDAQHPLTNSPTHQLPSLVNLTQSALTCPNCGSALEGRKCKLFCPRPGCGYLVTCSEW